MKKDAVWLHCTKSSPSPRATALLGSMTLMWNGDPAHMDTHVHRRKHLHIWVSQLSQLSLPSLLGRYMGICMVNGGGDHVNGRLRLRAAIWLQAKVRERGLGCGL